MKKIGTVLLCTVMAIGLTGCGNTQAGNGETEAISLQSVSHSCDSVTDNSEDMALAILGDNGKSLTLHQPALTTGKMLECLSDKTKMPDSTQEKINSSKDDTSTQRDSWDNLKLTWNWDSQGVLIAVFES